MRPRAAHVHLRQHTHKAIGQLLIQGSQTMHRAIGPTQPVGPAVEVELVPPGLGGPETDLRLPLIELGCSFAESHRQRIEIRMLRAPELEILGLEIKHYLDLLPGGNRHRLLGLHSGDLGNEIRFHLRIPSIEQLDLDARPVNAGLEKVAVNAGLAAGEQTHRLPEAPRSLVGHLAAQILDRGVDDPPRQRADVLGSDDHRDHLSQNLVGIGMLLLGLAGHFDGQQVLRSPADLIRHVQLEGSEHAHMAAHVLPIEVNLGNRGCGIKADGVAAALLLCAEAEPLAVPGFASGAEIESLRRHAGVVPVLIAFPNPSAAGVDPPTIGVPEGGHIDHMPVLIF